MATRISSTLLPSNSTDALFRAWVQFTEDTLVTTGGWVVTADTGQMTISTATAPAVANTKVGYRIYRMADALQATAPVFTRIDYGSATLTNDPGIWITIGTGSNGTGTITGIVYNGGLSSTPNIFSASNTVSGAHNSYGSASTNRISLGMFIQSANSVALGFTLERSKDENGNDTATAVILTGTNINTSPRWKDSRFLVLAGGGQPPVDTGLQYLLPSANPGTFGADVGVGVHIPFAGIAKYPILGLVIVRQADFAVEANFVMTMYGSVRTYQHLNAVGAFHAVNATADANSRICIRYD